MKLWVKNTILAVILVLIIAVPLLFWEPPSGEIESLFFCLQAGVGAGIVGFVLGRVTAKKKNDN